jgi:2,4-dienoyl-CoA reductase-like NADH-dependent reductase (Old Yellow Enzyme family)
MTTTLFTPITLGKLQLKNRIVMAPLTRCQSITDCVQAQACSSRKAPHLPLMAWAMPASQVCSLTNRSTAGKKSRAAYIRQAARYLCS